MIRYIETEEGYKLLDKNNNVVNINYEDEFERNALFYVDKVEHLKQLVNDGIDIYCLDKKYSNILFREYSNIETFIYLSSLDVRIDGKNGSGNNLLSYLLTYEKTKRNSVYFAIVRMLKEEYEQRLNPLININHVLMLSTIGSNEDHINLVISLVEESLKKETNIVVSSDEETDFEPYYNPDSIIVNNKKYEIYCKYIKTMKIADMMIDKGFILIDNNNYMKNAIEDRDVEYCLVLLTKTNINAYEIDRLKKCKDYKFIYDLTKAFCDFYSDKIPKKMESILLGDTQFATKFMCNFKHIDNDVLSRSLFLTDDTKTLKLLIDIGADVNYGDGIIYIDYYNRPWEVIKFFIENGADINGKVGNGNTLLHEVKKYDHVKYLISKGADVNAVNRLGNTPLFYHYKDLDTCMLLYECGANLGHLNDNNTDVIYTIREQGNIYKNIAKELIKNDYRRTR